MAVGIATFSEKLAHEIIYASDFLLVPSRFEPCGLVAFSALRYGTIPICPAIGGLKEIVESDCILSKDVPNECLSGSVWISTFGYKNRTK